jgi:hypothetical protein
MVLKNVFVFMLLVAVAMVVAYLFERKHIRQFHSASLRDKNTLTMDENKTDSNIGSQSTIDEIVDFVSKPRTATNG